MKKALLALMTLGSLALTGCNSESTLTMNIDVKDGALKKVNIGCMDATEFLKAAMTLGAYKPKEGVAREAVVELKDGKGVVSFKLTKAPQTCMMSSGGFMNIPFKVGDKSGEIFEMSGDSTYNVTFSRARLGFNAKTEAQGSPSIKLTQEAEIKKIRDVASEAFQK